MHSTAGNSRNWIHHFCTKLWFITFIWNKISIYVCNTSNNNWLIRKQMHYSFGFLHSTLLYSCALWKLNTTFLWFISFIKNNYSICVSKIWNIKWSSDQFNAFWSWKKLPKYKRSHQHDEHAFRSQWPDGKDTKCIAQFDIWNPVSGS